MSYPLPENEFDGKLTPRDYLDFEAIKTALKECRNKNCPPHTDIEQWDRYKAYLERMYSIMEKYFEKKKPKISLMNAIKGIV